MRRLTSEEFQEKLSTLIKQRREYNPQRVILFGSFARGDDHAMSDAGLLIVKETDNPFLARMSELLTWCEYHTPSSRWFTLPKRSSK